MNVNHLLPNSGIKIDRKNPWLIYQVKGWPTISIVISLGLGYFAGVAFAVYCFANM